MGMLEYGHQVMAAERKEDAFQAWLAGSFSMWEAYNPTMTEPVHSVEADRRMFENQERPRFEQWYKENGH